MDTYGHHGYLLRCTTSRALLPARSVAKTFLTGNPSLYPQLEFLVGPPPCEKCIGRSILRYRFRWPTLPMRFHAYASARRLDGMLCDTSTIAALCLMLDDHVLQPGIRG